MIPYIHIYDLKIGPASLPPFGFLVASGVAVGVALARRRARVLHLNTDDLMSFVAWMLVGGFVGGHVLNEIFYYPSEALAAPWSLIYLWAGLSSFGGFIGGLAGAVLWKYFEMTPALQIGSWEVMRPVRRSNSRAIIPYCDVVLAVFPVAWALGRLGCSVAHDHPGVRASATSPLAVAYGEGPVHSYGLFELRLGATPRYDLGFLEFLFTVFVAAIFALTWRRRLPVGTYVVALPLLYAPARFALDFLRLDDSQGGDLRYAGLTPAQWACIALFGFSLVLLVRFCSPARAHRWPFSTTS